MSLGLLKVCFTPGGTHTYLRVSDPVALPFAATMNDCRHVRIIQHRALARVVATRTSPIARLCSRRVVYESEHGSAASVIAAGTASERTLSLSVSLRALENSLGRKSETAVSRIS